MTPPLGTVIGGRYRLERVLGEGGMGQVFVATDLRLERPVAVKFLHEQLANADASFAERFRQEALAVCRIRHPAVIEIYDADVHEGSPWMAMALLDGETLGAVLARRTLGVDEAIWVALETLEGLVAVRDAGFVHRDLKPDNIFLQHLPRGRVQLKLLDFGIAKQVAGGMATTLTATGATIGTPWYVSPEQAAGSRALDHRSDLFSLAVIVFECLTQRRPYEADSFGALITQFYTNAPARLGDVVPGAPPALSDLLQGCLATDPAARPASAQVVIDRLSSLGIAPRPLEGALGASSSSSPQLQLRTRVGGPGASPPRSPSEGPGTLPMESAQLGRVVTPQVVEAPSAKPRSKGIGLLKVVAGLGILAACVLLVGGGAIVWLRRRHRAERRSLPPVVAVATPAVGGTSSGAAHAMADTASQPAPAPSLADVGLSTDPSAGVARVVVGAATQADGTGRFSPAVLSWALTEQSDAFVACYEVARRTQPALSGRIQLRVVLSPDGSVAQADATESTLGATTVVCVLDTIRQLRFSPGPAGGTITYVSPLLFGFGRAPTPTPAVAASPAAPAGSAGGVPP